MLQGVSVFACVGCISRRGISGSFYFYLLSNYSLQSAIK